MVSSTHIALLLTLALGAAVGCGTAPPSPAAKDELVRKAAAALRAWDGEAPGLEGFARHSHGYAIFPTVAKGGLGIGGAYGRGVVYEQDQHVGYADLSQASLGLQVGGQAYQVLMVFADRAALESFKRGRLDLSADGSGVIIDAGYAATVQFVEGITLFSKPIGGVMAEAVAFGGRWSSFVARDDGQPRPPPPPAGAPR
jgi:lipid-binding SYLF domain-containing protein